LETFDRDATFLAGKGLVVLAADGLPHRNRSLEGVRRRPRKAVNPLMLAQDPRYGDGTAANPAAAQDFSAMTAPATRLDHRRTSSRERMLRDKPTGPTGVRAGRTVARSSLGVVVSGVPVDGPNRTTWPLPGVGQRPRGVEWISFGRTAPGERRKS
jgi:hypothetical protein